MGSALCYGNLDSPRYESSLVNLCNNSAEGVPAFLAYYLEEVVDAVALRVLLRAGAAAQHQRRAAVPVAVVHVRSCTWEDIASFTRSSESMHSIC